MEDYKEVGFYISVNNELEFIETGSQEESLELAKIYLQSNKIQDYIIFKNGIKLDEEAEKNLKILGLKMYNRIMEYPKDAYSTIVSIRFKSIKNNETKVNETSSSNEIFVEKEEKKELVVESDVHEEETVSDEIEMQEELKSNYFSKLGKTQKVFATLAYLLGILFLFPLCLFLWAELIVNLMPYIYNHFTYRLDIQQYMHISQKEQIKLFFLTSIIFIIIYSRFLFKPRFQTFNNKE